MARLNHPPAEADLPELRRRALNLRRKMMDMASGKGEGYLEAKYAVDLPRFVAAITENR